jgi:integrase/recombinase XerD
MIIFLASKKIDGLSENTLKGYYERLNKFSYFIQKNIEDIDVMDIRMYLAAYSKTGVKNSTIAREIAILKSFFVWLENNCYILKSPMRNIKQIKVEKTLREALTAEELELVRDACETLRDRALIEFFYSTGCRLDEVVKLNKSDIDWQDLSLKVFGKGKKERIVFITPKAKIHLKKYLMSRLDDCEALFVTERKPTKRLGRRSYERAIDKLGKKAKLSKDLFPHLLRHTTATSMLRNGASLVEVQHYLGHEDPSTTQIYAHLSNDAVRAAHRKCLQ